MTSIEPPSGRRIDGLLIDDIARQIASAAEATGLGFLLATIVTDRILDGSLKPSSQGFEAALFGQAAELLLDDPETATTDRALLRAASAVGERGIPIGPVWEVAARAMDAYAEPRLEAQLALVRRLRRFLFEERLDGEVLYRPFHAALRAYFSEGLGRWDEPPFSTSEARGRMRDVAAALERLHREALASRPLAPGGARFLSRELPALLARFADSALLARAVRGTSDEYIERQIGALIAVADDALAIGQPDLAMERAQEAALLAGSAHPLAEVDAQVAISAGFRGLDDWRNARDVARYALNLATHLLANAPDSPGALRALVRAAAAVAGALGVGAFDADEGLELVDDVIERLAASSSNALLELAPDVADLLLVYPNFLNQVLGPSERLPPAAAARAILARLVENGAQERAPTLARATALEATCRLDTGDPAGLQLLRDAVHTLLLEATARGRRGLDALGWTGEITQRLGVAGLHSEAMHWINWGAEVFEQIHDAFGPGGEPALVLSYTLRMRSAVRAVLEDDDGALDDARRAADFVGVGNAMVPLASRLLDARRPEELLELAEGLPEPLWPQVAWWIPVARAEAGFSAPAPDETIRSLRSTLELLERASTPSPNILFREFVDFEAELRTALALARIYEQAGDLSSAKESLQDGARMFLQRVGLRSPRGLLHVRPTLLETYRPIWSADLLPAWLAPLTTIWAEAIDLLAQGGRESLVQWYPDELVRPVLDYQLSGDLRFADEFESWARDWRERRETSITTVADRVLSGLPAKPRSTEPPRVEPAAHPRESPPKQQR